MTNNGRRACPDMNDALFQFPIANDEPVQQRTTPVSTNERPDYATTIDELF